MGYFTTVEVASDFPLLAAAAELSSTFQTKDLPEDDELDYTVNSHCIPRGRILSDGVFVREDKRGSFTNPDLVGWAKLVRSVGYCIYIDLFCRFQGGRIVEVIWGDSAGVVESSINGHMMADDSPNNWIKLDIGLAEQQPEVGGDSRPETRDGDDYGEVSADARTRTSSEGTKPMAWVIPLADDVRI